MTLSRRASRASLVGGLRVASGSSSLGELVAFLLDMIYLTLPIGSAFQAVICWSSHTGSRPCARRTRLSSLAGGKVVAVGNHEELLATKTTTGASRLRARSRTTMTWYLAATRTASRQRCNVGGESGMPSDARGAKRSKLVGKLNPRSCTALPQLSTGGRKMLALAFAGSG